MANDVAQLESVGMGLTPNQATASAPKAQNVRQRQRRAFGRAETLVAYVGLGVALLLLATVAGYAWWVMDDSLAAQITLLGARETLWSGVMVLGIAGSLAVMAALLMYRTTHRRTRVLLAIRESLRSLSEGETDIAALEIGESLGAEAREYNQLLARGSCGNVRVGVGSVESAGSDSVELHSACDALAQGIVIVDDTLSIRYANGAATVLLRRGSELLGRLISDIVDEPAIIEALRSTAEGNTPQRLAVDTTLADGPNRSVLRLSARPVRRDEGNGAVLTIDDVTQQRVAEHARNTFVAQATHELRTPLTNIRLYVDSAIEDGDADPQVREKALNVISSESRRLERIVGEMLSVSEIEAGSFALQLNDVRLDTLFADLEKDYAAQAADKRIVLLFELPPKLPQLKGDRDKLSLSLHNLVGNALKYTPEGGAVTIVVDDDAKQLTVAVSDTGIGIAPDDLEHVFDRFYRAKDPRVGKITGSGLGLTLAREIVRLHGGELTAESEVDKGSTFTIMLPLNTGGNA